jgi:hypothetical protein
MKRRIIIASSVIAIISLSFVAFLWYQTVTNQPKSIGHWVLSISALGDGYTTPNGTLQVPMNQTMISVTATAGGYSSFIGWSFDGEALANQSHTVTIQRQHPYSTHSLEAHFSDGTPPMPTPIETNSPTPMATSTPPTPTPTIQVNQNQSVTLTLPSGVDVSYRLPWDSDQTNFNYGPTMNLSGFRLIISETGFSEVFPASQGVYGTDFGFKVTISEVNSHYMVILIVKST